MRRIFAFALAVVILCALLAPQVLGLGLSPTTSIVDFSPSKTISGSFTLVNSGHKDMRVLITASGELAKYIVLHNSIVTLKEEEASKTFTYELHLPASFPTPGLHEGDIVVTEIPANADQQGAFVGAAVSVSMQIKVRVPYPGTYAEASLDVAGANVNQSVTFVMPVTNLGTKDIAQAAATVNVLGPTNEKLGTVNSPQQGIPAQTTHEFVSSWRADVNPGIYQADAAVTYDGKVATAQRNFAVGNLYVDVMRADVKDFTLGGIAKITLTLQNQWNQDLPQVYAELFVYNNHGDQIYTTKSTFIPLAAQQTGALDLYWDTQGLPSGVYRATVIVHYSGKTTEKPMHLVVGQNSIDAQFVTATGQVIAPGAGATTASPLNMFLVVQILFIGLNIGLFFYFKHRIDAQKKPPEGQTQ